jgi:hypothetical protein
MKTPKNKIPNLFNFLYEISILNRKAIFIKYENGSSLDTLMKGSGSLPRKRKKKLRTLIKKSFENN